MGNRRIDRVEQGHLFLVKLSLIWGAVSVALFYAAGRPIAELFSKDDAVLKFLMIYMVIMPFVFGFRGLNHIGCCLMNAIRYPMHAAMVTFMRFVIFLLPIAILGAKWYGFKGFLLGIVAADIVTGIIATVWVRKLYHKGVSNLFYTELES